MTPLELITEIQDMPKSKIIIDLQHLECNIPIGPHRI